ncbi:MAG TPA: HNH endonuclease signature motif containing protein [Burkholderiaceae bacterium]
MTRPKLKLLQPRIPMVDTTRGIKMAPPLRLSKTLKERQAETGRTLALDGSAWRKLRASILAGEPLCRMCTARGLTVAATDVDHRDNNPANNDPVNLQPLCHECHSHKTNADMGHAVRLGCDASGMPLDPSHPWNDAPAGRVAALLRQPEPSRARETEITSDPDR